MKTAKPLLFYLATTYDDSLVEKYNFFIWEVVKAEVAVSARHPQTLHCMGEGEFMISGRIISRKSEFRPNALTKYLPHRSARYPLQ